MEAQPLEPNNYVKVAYTFRKDPSEDSEMSAFKGERLFFYGELGGGWADCVRADGSGERGAVPLGFLAPEQFRESVKPRRTLDKNVQPNGDDLIKLKNRLIRFYKVVDPKKAEDEVEVKKLVNWAGRRGEAALLEKIFQKYNIEVDQVDPSEKGWGEIQKRLKAYYKKHDPRKPKNEMDRIFRFTRQHGLYKLDLKLIEKYGEQLFAVKWNPERLSKFAKTKKGTKRMSEIMAYKAEYMEQHLQSLEKEDEAQRTKEEDRKKREKGKKPTLPMRRNASNESLPQQQPKAPSTPKVLKTPEQEQRQPKKGLVMTFPGLAGRSPYLDRANSDIVVEKSRAWEFRPEESKISETDSCLDSNSEYSQEDVDSRYTEKENKRKSSGTFGQKVKNVSVRIGEAIASSRHSISLRLERIFGGGQ